MRKRALEGEEWRKLLKQGRQRQLMKEQFNDITIIGESLLEFLTDNSVFILIFLLVFPYRQNNIFFS